MKRFIDLRGQGTGYRFAWYDTIRDEFEEFSTEQVWDTWDDFFLVCPAGKQERYKSLCPAWAFKPYTEADKDAEFESFWNDIPVTGTSMNTNAMIKRIERGWAGHFCCAHQCRFRRNTLLENEDIKIVISTVGLMEGPFKDGKFDTIGHNRYFETMAFEAEWDGRYWDANISKQIWFESPWSISEIDADDRANDMHERVVGELMEKMVRGGC